jgi:hypothetical protein
MKKGPPRRAFELSDIYLFTVACRWDFPPHLWDNHPFRQSYHSRNNSHILPGGPMVYIPAHVPCASPPQSRIIGNVTTTQRRVKPRDVRF